jgi:large subunit ribosomal protein L19e
MMNLDKRKALASKVLGVGKNKIRFDVARLADIKEAITKQDIRDMYNDGIISIKETRGKKKFVKRTTKRGPGKIKMKIRPGKRKYITLVRKFRRYVKELHKQGKLDRTNHQALRVKIKSGTFKNKAHLKEYIGAQK